MSTRRPTALAAALAIPLAVWAFAVRSEVAATGQAAAPVQVQAPAPGPIRQFNFPAYHTRKLANGLTVFVIEDHRQPLVAFTLLINAGGIAHSPEKAGLASMTAELLDKGTMTRSAQEIATAIDRIGGGLGGSADDDTATISATVVKSHASLAAELLADIVRNPRFAQDEIDRYRQQTLSGLKIQYADAEYLAPIVAARLTFGGHPYGYPVEGTPDTLAGINRDDIVNFHKKLYSPSGSYLAIAGDITPSEAVQQAEKYFGGWSSPAVEPAAPKPPPPPARSVLIVDKPDAVQTQIVVATVGIKRNDPDYFPLLIANQIFGGSFNSRLNLKLRAQEGLTYGARSGFDAERQTGMFRVSTFTRTEETGKAVSMLLNLLKDFRENPATETELKEAKAYLTGSFVIGSETPGQVAARVLAVAKYGLPAGYWDKYREDIQAVTPQQIATAVQRYVDPDAMMIVTVGNASVFAKSLEGLGPTRTILFSNIDLTRPDLVRQKPSGG